MCTLANSEDPDEIKHLIMRHFIRVYTLCEDKKKFRARNYNLRDPSIYAMDCPKFIVHVSNQEEEAISA